MKAENQKIIDLLFSISEALAEMTVTTEQALSEEEEGTPQNDFLNGMIHGIAHADQLIKDNIADILENKDN